MTRAVVDAVKNIISPSARRCRQSLVLNENTNSSEDSTVLRSQTTEKIPTSSGRKADVLLQTPTVIARDEEGIKFIKVKILFDSGSQMSYHRHAEGCSLRKRKLCTLTCLEIKKNSKTKARCSNFNPRRSEQLSCEDFCSPLSARVDTYHPNLQAQELANCSDTPHWIRSLLGRCDH